MALQACLVFVLALSAGAEVAVDETHEVSLLQTELHVVQPQQLQAVQKRAPATTAHEAVTTGQEAAPTTVTSAVATASIGVVVGLFAVAIVLYSCGVGRCSSTTWNKYVAEFVGTFMLVVSVGCNVLVGDETWGVTAIACTLMVMIYALGGVSGANFNPAVSLSLWLSNKLPAIEAAIYICVQLAAGAAAALVYGLFLGQTFELGPKDPYGWEKAGLAEMFYTFLLTFVVLNTAASSAHAGKDQFYGLAIGFTVVAGGYGAGSISGGCFNPAIAFAIYASTLANFGMFLLYVAFEVVGCIAAAWLFRVVRPEDFEESDGKRTKNDLTARLVSEFLGTFILVLTVGLNVLTKSKAGAFSIAASLMCMIFALGSCSGAHFNPAVTTAILASGRGLISVTDAVLYMLVQIIGGVLAAMVYVGMMGGRTVALMPGLQATANQALAGEFIFTFLLSFVVLSVATVKNPLSQYFGLAIGACVIAGGYAIGSLSGGSLNPAVSAGLAISDFHAKGGSMEHMVSYAAAEVFGGVVAAAMFQMTHLTEYTKEAEGL